VAEDQFPFETSQGKSETVVKHYDTILAETKRIKRLIGEYGTTQ
jgi:hypothetical protein